MHAVHVFEGREPSGLGQCRRHKVRADIFTPGSQARLRCLIFLGSLPSHKREAALVLAGNDNRCDYVGGLSCPAIRAETSPELRYHLGSHHILASPSPMLSRRTLNLAAAAAPLLTLAMRARAGAPDTLIVRNNRLFVNVTVNGHPVTALLDSAAEASFIDTGFARSIGVAKGAAVGVRGSGGDTSANLANGIVVDAVGVKLGPLTVAVLDLGDIGKRLLHEPLDFVLGRELFDATRLDIDINGGRIQSVPTANAPRGTHFALTTEKGTETFPASVEGHPPVQTVFDLGNGSGVLIGADYAKEIGILTDGRPVSTAHGGGIGGDKVRRTLTLKSIEIAGKTFTDIPAAIDATGSAAKLNVGVSLLRNFRIVTDYKARSLWLDSSR
jgi:predicted aspartyl protease